MTREPEPAVEPEPSVEAECERGEEGIGDDANAIADWERQYMETIAEGVEDDPNSSVA